MGEGSVVAVQLGLLIMAACALFGAGVAWAALTGRIRRAEERHDELREDVVGVQRDGHRARSHRQELELRVFAIEQRQGVPSPVIRRDHTPAPVDVPERRTTGRYGPTRGSPDESR